MTKLPYVALLVALCLAAACEPSPGRTPWPADGRATASTLQTPARADERATSPTGQAPAAGRRTPLPAPVLVSPPARSGMDLAGSGSATGAPAVAYAPDLPTLAPIAAAPALTATVRFAVIGDFGLSGPGEAAVSDLVHSWQPDFIITVGDNNYLSGSAATIDQNVGQYYHDFIYPYHGGYGAGAKVNRFFPTLGNHDWQTEGAAPYLDYFELPGNERYYDFTWGPLHLFAIDSDPAEPDGTTRRSRQARWLEEGLAGSGACWKLVYFHHPPFSSSLHAPSTWMRWPFAAWGADAVLSGHDHVYERIERDGFPYFVAGLGGVLTYAFGTPAAGSQVRYQAAFGALLVTAGPSVIRYEFVNVEGQVIDRYTRKGGCD